jgi:hypothetical protein
VSPGAREILPQAKFSFWNFHLAPGPVRPYFTARVVAPCGTTGITICTRLNAQIPQVIRFQPDGRIAQLVEQRTENPCVGGSIPPPATTDLDAQIGLNKGDLRVF